MVDIIPGILQKEWQQIYDRIALVAPYVQWVQIDIADNTLVPNATFLQFEKFKETESVFPGLSLEAHLMVAKPETYVKMLVDAGFKRIIAHVECNDPRLFLEQAQYEHVEVGVAIDGATEIEQIEPFLGEVDTVLVMTIEAGFSGQLFMPETVEKIKVIHENYPDLPIEVDGGINDQAAKIAKDAGATRLVSTSFLYKSPETIAAAIERLKTA